MPTQSTHTQNDTRDRLLVAALHAFGKKDYDGVSTREIVENAGANISAISYHFGSKQGLYHATLEYLAEMLHAEMIGELAQIRKTLHLISPKQCAELLSDVLLHFLEKMLLGEIGEHAPGIIFREQNQPSEAFDILYEKLLSPMHITLAQLIARYRGQLAMDEEVIIMAHAMIGQTVIFRIGRTTLLRRLNRSAYDSSDIDAMKSQLQNYYLALLNANPETMNTDTSNA